ncbi:Putative uncharacterized protein [Propionibacterium freudenreichii]|uniref:DUF6119 family protein n=1 Tax=Propionibacterium freudenreichii TaxID=1744 RepID=UPI0005A5C8A1|nr:DUF6119 family protein [Propionibacterium freudenreichii]MDK9674737.1 TIGR04141 family sporadically distributed protein [Propionibacterium freudenreichii]CEI47058.1 Putative uncharacterized protein [Propionibacterium freudenreichii]SCQ46473.1 Sporadically distributed protein, TIGR04141 family [Propionibacterium freudenreichii]SCQ52898.1 Sporadically distributed protein, TIGR04141 family [Propionibacterium freudenreichii]
MKSRRLTFYLLRDDIAEFDDALDPDKTSVTVEIDPATGIEGRFFYVKPQSSIPAWVNFVQPLLTDQLSGIRSASTSALLLLRTSGRIFALTFGYGRSLLDLSKIEYQFGLRVALNRIDPRQIRSLDTKTFEDLVVSTNTQASKSTELPTFGVDISRDILRAVTGEPRDQTFSKRIAGADSLVMGVKTTASKLPAICDDLLAAFTADEYKTDFGWIDQLSIVRDNATIEALNDLLIEQLRTGATGTTHLAMPETIDWEDIDGFKIGGTRSHVYEDLDLDDYLNRLGDERTTTTLENLKTRPVSVRFGRSGNFDKRWNLYQCIVTEQRLDDRLHVLIEGRWFAVSSTLVEEVDEFAAGLPDTRVALPPARSGEIEADYNTRLAETSPDHLLKLDARIKRPGGASSGIEFCDVLSDQGDLIHVKRKSRSATLSHLFAQGGVSASTFINDGVFRTRVRQLIENEVATESCDAWLRLVPKADDTVDKSQYRVTYAIIANSTREGHDWLPFFSKLNLMQQGRQLITMGFNVSVVRVPITDSE